ncbi:MAG: sugar ABC transporter permease [Actinobacteria bacterium]|nr:sugar ABC transporter permease [Actinomycetota bacterium]
MALVIAFIGVPLGSVIYHGFTSWNGFSPPRWVGLDNFKVMWEDPIFLRAIRNNVLFALSVPIEVVGALILAHLIHERIPGWRFFRSTFFLPAIYSTVVIGILTSVVLLPQGPFNQFLGDVGLSGLQHNWLESTGTALGAIILVVVWANFGYSVLIYLAGMTSLDPQLAEAARLDGAGFWKILWKVHAPNLRRVIELVFVINTITAFAYMLPYIYTMTHGGPGYSTFATEYYIYETGFSGGHLGYASAIGVMLALIVLVIGAVQIRVLTRGEK